MRLSVFHPIVAVLISASQLLAEPIALEVFPLDTPGYEVGEMNLVGSDSLAEGLTGPWLEAFGGSESADVLSSSLTYAGFPTYGGSIGYPLGGSGRSGRLFTTPYDDQTDATTVYFSALMQGESISGGTYRALELHNGGFDDGGNRKIQIALGEAALVTSGVIPTADNYAVRLFNNNTAALSGDLGAGDADVNFFVIKMEFSATASSDTITVWRNPGDLSAEGNNPADFTATGFDLQIDRVSVACFGFAQVAFDEFRLGSDWADVTSADTFDTDMDGMRDDWERANELSVGTDDAGIDNDTEGGPDGLTNEQEFALGTHPQKFDTDRDGFGDGAEDNGGIWVSNSQTGTDPLNPDTDGDRLLDGAENCDGSFSTLLDTGTDPNNPDSDNDGARDRDEIEAGTSPTDDSDTPSPGDLNYIGLDFFDLENGSIDGLESGEGFDFSNASGGFIGHTSRGSSWAIGFGTPAIECGTLRTRNSGALRTFNGPTESDVAAGGVDGTTDGKIVYVKAKMTRRAGVTYSGISFLAGTTEIAFVGVPFDVPNSGMRTFGLQEFTLLDDLVFSMNDTMPEDRVSYVLVAKLNFSDEEVTLYLNPNLAQSEQTAATDSLDSEAAFDPFEVEKITAIRLASGGTGETIWDDLVVSRTWEGLSTAATDTNNNELRDTWESTFSQSDPLANPDTDDLNNLAEQNEGTHPTVSDSDGDTLSDGAEVNDHSTNPCFMDTDDDGSADNVELANNTDPNDPSDGEAFLIDGQRELSYETADTVQTIETGFGDNQSEWNAAYSQVRGEMLALLFTGNLEANFNKLEIFIDSSDAVTSNTFTSAGNDAADSMNGMIFDTGFSPDYHFILRRGSSKFDLDFADLGARQYASYIDVFGGTDTGSGLLRAADTMNSTFESGPGDISIGYDNSNVAGVGGTGGMAADQAAAQAVSTGLELAFPLSNIGNPSGTVRIMILQNNSGHDFLANQSLAGLPEGTANLGNPATIDFGTFEGNQFYEIALPAPETPLTISDVSLENGSVSFTASGLQIGVAYHVQSSASLGSTEPFSAVPDSEFQATESTKDLSIDATGAVNFYRLIEGTIP